MDINEPTSNVIENTDKKPQVKPIEINNNTINESPSHKEYEKEREEKILPKKYIEYEKCRYCDRRHPVDKCGLYCVKCESFGHVPQFCNVRCSYCKEIGHKKLKCPRFQRNYTYTRT